MTSIEPEFAACRANVPINGNTNRTARMLIIICFNFMMLIASLVEFAIAKLRMWQQHNGHLPNFDMTSFSNADEKVVPRHSTELLPALLFFCGGPPTRDLTP